MYRRAVLITILALILALGPVATVASAGEGAVSALAGVEPSWTTVGPVSTYGELQAAVDAAGAGDPTEILISKAVSVLYIDLTKELTVTGGKIIKLISEGGANRGTIHAASQKRVINVKQSELWLENITVAGGQLPVPYPYGDKDGAGVRVEAGKLYIGDGAVITDNIVPSRVCGTGGGVAAVDGSTVTMTGGEICNNNTASSAMMEDGGGGVYLNNSRFIMTGGEIYGNAAGNGADASGGMMSQSCNGGGVYASYGSVVEIYGGKIHDNWTLNLGGGIYIDYSSTASLSDVKIYGNHVTSIWADGGGIGVGGGSLTIDGATEITGNDAGRGGGVFVSGDVVIKSGVISGNTASSGAGLAIHFGSTGTMSGGAIINNVADGPYDSFGGGVYVNSEGAFTMTGGIIDGNTANTAGGGICSFGYAPVDPNIIITGTAKISNNRADGISASAGDWAGGGGIFLNEQARAAISGNAEITGNTATNANGGGIYMVNTTAAELSGNAKIMNNSAPKGDGGGIWADFENWSLPDPGWSAGMGLGVLTVSGPGVMFSGNTAQAAYDCTDPVFIALHDTNITPNRSWSIPTTYGYNNYDISYTEGPVWVPPVYTVTFVDGFGTTLATEKVKYGAAATAPKDPVYSGYTFSKWDKDFSNITGDLTVTALWNANPKPPVTPPPVAPPPVTPPPAAAPKTPAAAPPALTIITPAPSVSPIIPEETPPAPVPPVQNIAPPETPLAAPHAFSLLSMILAVAGVLMAALLLIFIPVRNRYFDSEYAFLNDYGLLTDEAEKEMNKRRSRGFAPRLLAVLAGIAAFIVWLLVDLPLDSAVWINRWTPLVAVLFIACLALTVLYNARKQHPGEGAYSEAER